MQPSASPTIGSREVIEIDSDTDSDPGDGADPFSSFFDLEAIDQAFPDIPDYAGYEVSNVEQIALPHHETTEAALQPVVITDPEVLYQLYQDRVLEVFPDICHDYLKELYDTHTAGFAAERSQLVNEELSQTVIMEILDAEKYPTENDKKKKLKRKRTEGSDDEEEEFQYTRPNRAKITAAEIQDARLLLLWEFASVPLTFIDLQLKTCGNLYPAYLALELGERTYDQTPFPLYRKLQKSRKTKSTDRDNLSSMEPMGHIIEGLRKELKAAKRKREKEADKIKKEQIAADADAALEKECIEKGEMVECQCCFTDTPLPKSTHCNDSHFFCLDCAQRNVKSQIELSRYEINCIDGSGCKAGFTLEQKHRFLDAKLLGVLDRLQQQAELRTAGLENLESCPFCDYAAIYPPVAEDKEFRCKMPDCERISCRLCKADSHLPLSCAEYRKEHGVSERHILEEAMTNAIIRTCPKCGVPIFKDGGCNKMVCSKCKAFVCDFCGKDISKESYGHFENGAGSNPLGKKKCPTQDNTIARNAERIAEAEKEAMAKVRAENPDLSEEDLKIKFSAKVSNDGNGGSNHHAAAVAQLAVRIPPAVQTVRQRVRDEAQWRRTQQEAATTNTLLGPAREMQVNTDPFTPLGLDHLAQPQMPFHQYNRRTLPNPHPWMPVINQPYNVDRPGRAVIAETYRPAHRRHAEPQWNDFDGQDEFGEDLEFENPDFWTPRLNTLGATIGAAPMQFDPVHPYNDVGMGNQGNYGYGLYPGLGPGVHPGNFVQPVADWAEPLMAPAAAPNQGRADLSFPPRMQRRY